MAKKKRVEILTAEEAADRLGVPLKGWDGVRSLLQKGHLYGRLVGGGWVTTSEAVDEFLGDAPDVTAVFRELLGVDRRRGE